MTEDWAEVAAAINSRMAEIRMTQRELADRSGVSVATLRHLQQGSGRRATNKTLVAVSQALGLTDDHLVAVLVGRESESTPEPSLLRELATIRNELGRITERLERIEKSHLR